LVRKKLYDSSLTINYNDSSLTLTISHYTMIKIMFMYFCVWFSWLCLIVFVPMSNVCTLCNEWALYSWVIKNEANFL